MPLLPPTVPQRGHEVHAHLQPRAAHVAAGPLERLPAIPHPLAKGLPQRLLGFAQRTRGALTPDLEAKVCLGNCG